MDMLYALSPLTWDSIDAAFERITFEVSGATELLARALADPYWRTYIHRHHPEIRPPTVSSEALSTPPADALVAGIAYHESQKHGIPKAQALAHMRRLLLPSTNTSRDVPGATKLSYSAVSDQSQPAELNPQTGGKRKRARTDSSAQVNESNDAQATYVSPELSFQDDKVERIAPSERVNSDSLVHPYESHGAQNTQASGEAATQDQPEESGVLSDDGTTAAQRLVSRGAAPARFQDYHSLETRPAISGNSDEEEVEVVCKKCGDRKLDKNPTFLKETGMYLHRKISCRACVTSSGTNRKKPGTSGSPLSIQTVHRPYDKRPSMPMYKLVEHLNAPKDKESSATNSKKVTSSPEDRQTQQIDSTYESDDPPEFEQAANADEAPEGPSAIQVRGPDPNNEDEIRVPVTCDVCGQDEYDNDPLFLVYDPEDIYVRKSMTCIGCDGDLTMHHPTDRGSVDSSMTRELQMQVEQASLGKGVQRAPDVVSKAQSAQEESAVQPSGLGVSEEVSSADLKTEEDADEETAQAGREKIASSSARHRAGYDKTYVEAHPKQNFWHAGGGTWYPGFPPTKNPRFRAVRGPGAAAWKASLDRER